MPVRPPIQSPATCYGPWDSTRMQVRSSLRFGIGRFNTAEEIDFAVQFWRKLSTDSAG